MSFEKYFVPQEENNQEKNPKDSSESTIDTTREQKAEAKIIEKFSFTIAALENFKKFLQEKKETRDKKFLERLYTAHGMGLLTAESILIATLQGQTGSSALVVSTLAMIGLTFVKVGEFFDRETTDIGSHLTIQKIKYNTLEYTHEEVLSDGFVVKPGMIAGEIHFGRSINDLTSQGSQSAAKKDYIRHTKEILTAMDSDMCMLAKMCTEDDPRLEGIEFFYGRSHLTPKKDGVDKKEIRGLVEPIIRQIGSSMYLAKKTGQNEYVQSLKRKDHSANLQKSRPYSLFISRKKLVDVYGPGTEESEKAIEKRKKFVKQKIQTSLWY